MRSFDSSEQSPEYGSMFMHLTHYNYGLVSSSRLWSKAESAGEGIISTTVRYPLYIISHGRVANVGKW